MGLIALDAADYRFRRIPTLSPVGLGADGGHGGTEYEQLLVDGVLVLHLHRLDWPAWRVTRSRIAHRDSGRPTQFRV